MVRFETRPFNSPPLQHHLRLGAFIRSVFSPHAAVCVPAGHPPLPSPSGTPARSFPPSPPLPSSAPAIITSLCLYNSSKRLLVSAAAAHRRGSCGTKLGDIIIIIFAPDCLHDTRLEVAIKHARSRRRWNDSERWGGGMEANEQVPDSCESFCIFQR